MVDTQKLILLICHYFRFYFKEMLEILRSFMGLWKDPFPKTPGQLSSNHIGPCFQLSVGDGEACFCLKLVLCLSLPGHT